MSIKVKPKVTTYRVQTVARAGNKALYETQLPSGNKVISMKQGTFLSAKQAAARALSKSKTPA